MNTQKASFLYVGSDNELYCAYEDMSSLLLSYPFDDYQGALFPALHLQKQTAAYFTANRKEKKLALILSDLKGFSLSVACEFELAQPLCLGWSENGTWLAVLIQRFASQDESSDRWCELWVVHSSGHSLNVSTQERIFFSWAGNDLLLHEKLVKLNGTVLKIHSLSLSAEAQMLRQQKITYVQEVLSLKGSRFCAPIGLNGAIYWVEHSFGVSKLLEYRQGITHVVHSQESFGICSMVACKTGLLFGFMGKEKSEGYSDLFYYRQTEEKIKNIGCKSIAFLLSDNEECVLLQRDQNNGSFSWLMIDLRNDMPLWRNEFWPSKEQHFRLQLFEQYSHCASWIQSEHQRLIFSCYEHRPALKGPNTHWITSIDMVSGEQKKMFKGHFVAC